jgi:hypothetical protein
MLYGGHVAQYQRASVLRESVIPLLAVAFISSVPIPNHATHLHSSYDLTGSGTDQFDDDLFMICVLSHAKGTVHNLRELRKRHLFGMTLRLIG